MANRYIEKAPLDGTQLLEEIHNAGYTLRKLAMAVGVSDRTIREYIKKNEIPVYLIQKINKILLFPGHPRKEEPKKLWMRIGVSVLVTEEELYSWMKRSREDHQATYWSDGFADINITDEEAAEFMKRAVFDGDSYIPGDSFMFYLKWFREQEEKKKNAQVRSPIRT